MGGFVAEVYGLTNITVCNEKTVFCKERNCILFVKLISQTRKSLSFKRSKTVIFEMRKAIFCEYAEMRKTCEMILFRFL